MYHRTATESCEEALVELIDYCYRKFVNMVSRLEQMTESERAKQKAGRDPKELLNMQPEDELQRQFDDIEFSSTMTCLSLIRFITDHMEGLPASIIH